MARTLKVAIYQLDGEDESVRAALLAIEGLRIVGQWDGTSDLLASVTQARCDALVVLLNGPSVQRMLEQVATLAKERPDLTVIGAGLPNDPALLKTAVKSRLSELIDLPIEPEKLLGVLQQVAERQAERKTSRLVAVRGTGGGCGSTFLAVNLAVELSRRNVGRVVLVDLDLKYGHAATMLDVSPAFTIAELAQQSAEYDEQVLNNALAKHDSGVLILSRPKDPESANVSLVRIAAILNALLEYFEWVVVDETVRSDITARVVQDLADDLLLVTQPVVSSVRNGSQIVSGLSSGFNLERLRLVVNRVPRKPGAVTPDKIAETLKRPVFCQIPDENEIVCGAINLGLPLATHAPDSRVRAAIVGLACQLTGGGSGAGSAAGSGAMVRRLKGLFGRG